MSRPALLAALLTSGGLLRTLRTLCAALPLLAALAAGLAAAALAISSKLLRPSLSVV